MTKLFAPLLLALIVTGCGTTGGPSATVEDRTGGKPEAGSSTQTTGADSKATTGAAETTPLTGAGVAGSTLDGKQLDGGSGNFAGDPRKDPDSPLAKRSIFFDYDSFVVKDEYRGVLEAHAGYLLANKDARAILQGNTDERGSREYNLALGQKRAEAVRKALGLLGVGDVQIEAVSFGEEKPRNEADTEEAFAENRRVDLVYTDE
ncbi:MAG: peptidoglycan-associated lipoprotein [Hydrogenophilales bacterium 16-64-46]|nr:MAG: peptidoglycan-associated lipoprotein [Hydrogenophilales bacterium 12-64-13]OYZ04416.1 MAG: peptidoglycan-associated lipoprotein [Hydrogenophilales bacterium 16-64-46]OZA38220.1 MAG: peptidoglycan-associated lipoprotein [Hydrogenophilales bacterium 17-64-34]HQS99123.1 peptidoglycan-associated lipoprotein Pal [Thiobacillus sp.]